MTSLLVTALTAVVFLNDFGHFDTDIKPEVYLAPWDMAGRYLSSWTGSPYLGSANFNVGLVPVLLVLGLLRAIGLSPEWAFKVFHLALWLIAAWGTNRLTRAAAPRSSRWVGLVAGTCYLANPYAIAAGNTLAIALPMAFLPWMLLMYLRALQRPRSWGAPAAFGLAFFAMSGMNVAVVPLLQLLGIVPIAVVARWHHHRSWRTIVAVTAKCGLFVVMLSLYWLVPGVAALGAGTQVVDSSETLNGIHKVSSLTEVLRGLGLWPLYGHGDTGPWVPQNAVYVASGWVIALTALWPAAAVLGMREVRSGARRVLALGVAVAAVVMVGVFPAPGRSETPAGWLIQAVLDFPPLAAFRTTNKIGALLTLAFAIGLGFGCLAAVRAMRQRSGLAPLAAAAASVVVAAWILPALAGGLYISRMDIPTYWRQAAAAADKGNPNATSLLLPGQTRPTYRWTPQRPDDLTNSLLKRDAVIPETSPNASIEGANFLAALDDTVQSGTATGPVVSTFARYLGSDNILLRHDVVWENDGGARPATTSPLLGQDDGLRRVGTFGRPGENVVSPSEPPVSSAEARLSPVQLYAVQDPRTAVRAESVQHQVIVAGDGWAFPQMSSAGLLRGTPAVRYAQDLSPQQLSTALTTDPTLVLTDTNARRNAIPQRLTAGEGALLGPDDKLGNTRTIGQDPDDQTVLVRSGAQVTATSAGGTFFDMPYAAPENAFDGNPATSWRFGDFRRATGQRITFTLPTAQTLGDIPVSQPDLGPVKIDTVTLTANGHSVQTRVPDTGAGVIHMGGVTASKVTLTVDSLRGSGFNLVGLSEVGLPGPNAARAARTPTTLTRLYAGLDTEARKRFEETPLDILLTRVQNTPAAADDSEVGLRRVVSIPNSRDFTATARIRLGSGSIEDLYDRSAGYESDRAATSSGFWFDLPEYRASAAADGSSSTGWIPGGGTPKGQWWQLEGEPRDLSSIKITQKSGLATPASTQWATHATFTVDGRTVARSDLTTNGTTTVSLPPGTHGRTVRMTIDRISGPAKGQPSTFTSIDTGVSLRTSEPSGIDRPGKNRCLDVATVDGHPVPMRLTSSRLASPDEQGTAWEACAPVHLGSGDHRIEQAGPFVIDSLSLTDRRSGQAPALPSPVEPTYRVTKNTNSAKSMALTRTATPTAIVIGQSFDKRWHASLAGRDLGEPTTIDGFSTGWLLPPGAHGTVDITFGPQRYADIALGISLLALLVSSVLAVRLWRSGPAPEPHRRDEWLRAQHDTHTESPTRRRAKEVAFILACGFALGIPGLLGALAVVVAVRRRGVGDETLVTVGAAIIVAGMGLFLALDQSLGQVSADAIAASMWPHRVCSVGLVVALAGLMRRMPPSPEPTTRRARREGATKHTTGRDPA